MGFSGVILLGAGRSNFWVETCEVKSCFYCIIFLGENDLSAVQIFYSPPFSAFLIRLSQLNVVSMSLPKVFISYSHKDEAWKNRLLAHLGDFECQGLLAIWEDRRIETGLDWYPEICNAVDESSAAVLLISENFLHSFFIQREEVPRLLERRKNEGLRIFPIFLSQCNWQDVPWLKAIQIYPSSRPLVGGDEQQIDADLTFISLQIAGTVQAVATGEQKPAQTVERSSALRALRCPMCGAPVTVNETACPYCRAGLYLDGYDSVARLALEKVSKFLEFYEQSSQPETLDTMLSKGLAHLRLGVYENAAAILQEACRKHPNSAKAFFYFGVSLVGGRRPRSMDLKDIQQAERALAAALRLDPSNATYLFFLAAMKADFYLNNGLRDSSPSVMELMERYGKSRTKDREADILLRLVGLSKSEVYRMLKV